MEISERMYSTQFLIRSSIARSEDGLVSSGLWSAVYTFEIVNEQHSKTNFKLVSNAVILLTLCNGIEIRTGFSKQYEELAPRDEPEVSAMIRLVERQEKEFMRQMESFTRSKVT